MKVIKFGSDTKHRKQWFTGISFSHPAKMSLPLQLWLIDNFTKEGETILDPMAGSGTILVACSMGRNVITLELEDKFVQMQKDNWEKIKQRGCQLGYSMGTASILQGDARNLEGLLVDNCIFSPPFASSNQRQDIGFLKKIVSDQSAKYRSGENIGHYASPEAITRYYEKQSAELSNDNISNLPYGSINAVISSPPYEDSLSEPEDRKHSIDQSKWGDGRKIAPPHSQVHLTYPSSSPNNIGNLKSDSYLSAMLLVYQNCFAVLKAQGLLILVTKNFIRKKAQVRLDLDTIKLCEQAGFTFKDRWYRELTSQSFWRTIYHQKYLDVEPIKYEDILVFQK